MTRAEWEVATDAYLMLGHLGERADLQRIVDLLLPPELTPTGQTDYALAWFEAGRALDHGENAAPIIREMYRYREVPFDPMWRTPAVLALAAACGQDADLPGVLADAMEESGCLDRELLGHLRGVGPHVTGRCWALDAVLGRG